ncbi:hypothetical protein [Modestobacter sp. VKM Ac-2978]|uniref:hypothetical protein n=1 Tax=Modestobacter sp. VKM Ac-2978 TaxID=3004132 RepID=UPI0022AAB4E8|nr:hypothetical protein [Modestobacter sp. VKM Ac-2978]MCZ2850013.1 hypothetical protein [Modestobacter sp. VKM Ac-2978]
MPRGGAAAVHNVWRTPAGFGVLVTCSRCRALHAHRVGPDGDLAVIRRGQFGATYLIGGAA